MDMDGAADTATEGAQGALPRSSNTEAVEAMTDEEILQVANEVFDYPFNLSTPQAQRIITLARRIAAMQRAEIAKHFDGSDTWIYRSEVAAAIRRMGDE